MQTPSFVCLFIKIFAHNLLFALCLFRDQLVFYSLEDISDDLHYTPDYYTDFLSKVWPHKTLTCCDLFIRPPIPIYLNSLKQGLLNNCACFLFNGLLQTLANMKGVFPFFYLLTQLLYYIILLAYHCNSLWRQR